jgi:hypothetical protein
MRPRLIELSLWSGAGVALVAAAIVGRASYARLVPLSMAGAALVAPTLPTLPPASELARLASRTSELDVFSATAEEVAAPAPPPASPRFRPSLLVRGTVGAAGAYAALISGVPGREEPVLVRQGDTLAGITVRLVTRDSIVVRSLDSTWAIRVRASWQP